MSVTLVVDMSRSALGRANECQTRHQTCIGKHPLDISLYSDTILYQQHHRLAPIIRLVEQRTQQRRKQMVVGGLQPHYDNVYRRHICSRRISIDIVKMKRTVARVDLQPVAADIVVVGMQQEVDITVTAGKLAP